MNYRQASIWTVTQRKGQPEIIISTVDTLDFALCSLPFVMSVILLIHAKSWAGGSYITDVETGLGYINR